jgi:hypothetical protein
MAVVIAVTSDLHCGGTTALCPPRIELDDGGAYEASRAQCWLWSLWGEFWEWAARIRDREQAALWGEWNGDITDGNHHGTTQILSGNPTAQAHVVDACMAVPLSLGLERLFFVRGTEAHVGTSAAYEERIARGMEKDGRPVVGDPDTGTASWWHLRAEVEGVPLDFAHHGRMGQRPWTRPNVTANLAAEIFYEHARDGVPHPHLAVRSHLHRYMDTYDQHPVRVVQTPAWQLATSYIHRIAPESIADIGGLAIVIRDGEYRVEKFIRRPSRGSVWKP